MANGCTCHPTSPGLPSELLEPALAGAFSLCLRQLLRSDRSPESFAILAEQTRAIMRVAICARATDGSPNGAHANIAAGNLLSLVERLRDGSPELRASILATLAAHA